MIQTLQAVVIAAIFSLLLLTIVAVALVLSEATSTKEAVLIGGLAALVVFPALLFRMRSLLQSEIGAFPEEHAPSNLPEHPASSVDSDVRPLRPREESTTWRFLLLLLAVALIWWILQGG